MAKRDWFRVANGCLAVLVTICGITLSILTRQLVQKIIDVIRRESELLRNYNISTSYWAIGFIYIIPGVTGVIASVVHKKGGYITYMVFSIVALVILITSFFWGLRSSSKSLFDSSTCYMQRNTCICDKNHLKILLTVGFTCDEISSAISVGLGSEAALLLGGIFAFVSLFLAGKLGCVQGGQQGTVMETRPQQLTHLEGVTSHGGYHGQAIRAVPRSAQLPGQPYYANPAFEQGQPGMMMTTTSFQPGAVKKGEPQLQRTVC